MRNFHQTDARRQTFNEHTSGLSNQELSREINMHMMGTTDFRHLMDDS